LATVAEALEVRLLDHFIFAGTEAVSFRESGLL
jgi:DNA repair protein RadC